MARALSIDLRHRVLDAMRQGATTHAAAERFGIAIATAVRWRSQDRSGRTDPLPMGGDRRSGRIEAEADFLLALVDEADDITLHEMRRRLADERGLAVGVGTLWRFFDRRGITWKKTAHASEQDLLPFVQHKMGEQGPTMLSRRSLEFLDRVLSQVDE